MCKTTQMSDRVKGRPRRRYDSPRRREQAEATRRAILESAQILFLRDGYSATTMTAIASGARVALKTVYVNFETKSGVLRALWNLRLRGDRDDVPVAEQSWYREMLEEPDPEKQLRRNAGNSRRGKTRVGALAEVIRGAASLDPDMAALWKRIGTEYRENQRVLVESLARKRALRRGLDVDRAADILWAINHPTTWQLLVVERGWTAEEYERWAAEAACSQLLRGPAAGRGGRRRG